MITVTVELDDQYSERIVVTETNPYSLTLEERVRTIQFLAKRAADKVVAAAEA
jgi:hypothetical protein